MDEGGYQAFLASVRTAVADGGPTEQRALFDCSPLGEKLAAESPLLFQNLSLIDRDRPHRYRSVLRGAWESVERPIQDFLSELVTGEKSLAKLLEHSSKFGRLFQQAQRASRDPHVSGPHFAQCIRNLAYAEHRYDSRSRPLFRLFSLLPVAIDTLQLLAAGGGNEAALAESLLTKFAGEAGFVRVVGAAVAADALVLGWEYIRLDDSAAADYALTGPRAAQLLADMEALLLNGGIFSPQAEGTLTHCALRALRDRMVLFGGNAVVLGWPHLDSPGRREPARMARRLGLLCLTDSLLAPSYCCPG